MKACIDVSLEGRNRSLQDFARRCAGLTEQLKESATALATEKEKVKKLQDSEVVLGEKLQESQRRIKELEAERTEAERKNREEAEQARLEVERLNQKIKEFEDNLALERSKSESLEKQAARLSGERDSVKAEYESVLAAKVEAEVELGSKEVECGDLKAKVAELRDALDDTTEKVLADITHGAVLWVQAKHGPLDVRGIDPPFYMGTEVPFDPYFPCSQPWLDWHARQELPATPATPAGGGIANLTEEDFPVGADNELSLGCKDSAVGLDDLAEENAQSERDT